MRQSGGRFHAFCLQRGASCANLLQKNLDQAGIKISPAFLANLIQRFFPGPAFAIGPVRGDGIPDVHNSEEARL